jgi:hypothetical protein
VSIFSLRGISVRQRAARSKTPRKASGNQHDAPLGGGGGTAWDDGLLEAVWQRQW